MSVGASSSTNALAYLQQLLQQGTAGAGSTGAADPLAELMQTLSGSGSGSDPLTSSSGDTAAGSGASGCQSFGSDMMSQLLSLQSQQTQGQNGPEQAFFSKLDTDGDGKISKTEFEDAASKAGADSSVADAVFDKIDGDSDGSVSQSELAKADHPGGHHHVHGGGGGGGEGGGLDALMSGAGADGATTKTTTNADGSTTTSITYADGSSIDMNTPATATTSASTSTSSDGSSTDSSSSNTSSNKTSLNLIEQLIKMQSQMLSAMQASASTMSIAA
jgi:hypothetical protein